MRSAITSARNDWSVRSCLSCKALAACCHESGQHLSLFYKQPPVFYSDLQGLELFWGNTWFSSLWRQIRNCSQDLKQETRLPRARPVAPHLHQTQSHAGDETTLHRALIWFDQTVSADNKRSFYTTTSFLNIALFKQRCTIWNQKGAWLIEPYQGQIVISRVICASQNQGCSK